MAWLGLSSNGTRASLVIFVIAFSLLVLTLSLNFGHFDWLSKGSIVDWFSKGNFVPSERDQSIMCNQSNLGNINLYILCYKF
jgi:hypothetical protein